MQQYEILLQQGTQQMPMIKSCERQLAYLVKVTNSLLSYGLPAGVTKQSRVYRRSHSQDMMERNSMQMSGPGQAAMSQPTTPDPSQVHDFQIVAKILQLGRMTNQLRQ